MFSTVTKTGRTTIPCEIRKSLGIRPGVKLEYKIDGDRIIVRVHRGLLALKGALASDKGRLVSLAQIRQTAAAERSRGRAK